MGDGGNNSHLDCLYQGHTDNIITRYLKETGRENCITCKEDRFNDQCAKRYPVDIAKKSNLIDNTVIDYFLLKYKPHEPIALFSQPANPSI